jgi:type IV pilus assembly protein PilQ
MKKVATAGSGLMQKASSRRMACLGAALIVLGAPVVGGAKAPDNTIVSIDTKKVDGGREVVIHTSKTPTFSVFRLSDPMRVLIDVSDARAERGNELVRVEDGLIRHVSTHNFSDELSALARVEISLSNDVAYDVKAAGSSIVVRFTGKAQPETATPVQVEPAVVPEASEPAAPAPTKTPALIGKIEKQERGESIVLSAPISGDAPAQDAVSIQQLEDPVRLVVDIAGATADPKWQKVSIQRRGIERARLGAQDGGVRLVFDLKKGAALPEVSVEAESGKLIVKLTPAKVERHEAVAEKAIEKEAAEPAPVASKKTAETKAKVSDVRFEQKDGFVRLTVELTGEVTPVKDASSTKQLQVLRLASTSLPEELVRTLDTTSIAGKVVSAISTYTEGSDVLIAANVDQDTEQRHWQKGNTLNWDFRTKLDAAPPAPVAAAAAPATVVPYPTVATAGYQSEAANLGLAQAGQRRNYTGRRISLDLKDADIQNVLRLLADVSKLNIVAADDVKGKITLKLRNVPWDQALDIILRAKQLDKTRSGNIIRVAPIEVLQKEEEIRLARKEASEKLEPLSVRLIPVSYAVAKEIEHQVKALLSPRGKVNIDVRTNVLVIEDVADVLQKAERLVRTLDTQTPQVLIEARIVQALSSFNRELGIQWGGQVNASPEFGNQTGLTFPNTIRIAGGSDDTITPTGGTLSEPSFAVNLPATVGTGAGGSLGFVFGSAGGSALLALRLTAAEANGKTKIISSPKVVTLDNKKAKILSGEKIPITVLTANGPSTRFIEANLELEVTPHVTQDGAVLMSINASQNQLSDRTDILGTPGIISREANTEMLVRDGDTAVLGGIYRRSAAESANLVPFFGEIPVIGWIFKTTQRTDSRDELLIFISPRIVNRSEAMVQSQ